MGSGASAAICDEEKLLGKKKKDESENKVYFTHKTRTELFSISDNYLFYKDFISMPIKFKNLFNLFNIVKIFINFGKRKY